ncbi:MAG: hypothetical protein HOP29_10910 [Phycisphaerales bacterium]|nr:hypothetical protein [Phycisphaerales bacterium]
MNAGGRVIAVGDELPAMEPAGAAMVRGNGRGSGGADAKRSGRPGGRGEAVRRRFGLLNAFIDLGMPHLPRSALAAWLALYRHAKPDGTVTASVGDLARRCGCSCRAMQDALGRLQASGCVERLKRGSLAGGPSVWRLLTPDAEPHNRKRAAG